MGISAEKESGKNNVLPKNLCIVFVERRKDRFFEGSRIKQFLKRISTHLEPNKKVHLFYYS